MAEKNNKRNCLLVCSASLVGWAVGDTRAVLAEMLNLLYFIAMSFMVNIRVTSAEGSWLEAS